MNRPFLDTLGAASTRRRPSGTDLPAKPTRSIRPRDAIPIPMTSKPAFVTGDALHILKQLPAASIDCVMTSPPYWGKREYENGGIGLEKDYRDFIRNLLLVFGELQRVLKPAGSFWLNIGDSYKGKHLLGIPWRVALELFSPTGLIDFRG